MSLELSYDMLEFKMVVVKRIRANERRRGSGGVRHEGYLSKPSIPNDVAQARQ